MKKKIVNFICTLCLLATCAFAFVGCKKGNDVSYAFYLGDTQIENSSLSYNYGYNVSDVFGDIQLKVTINDNTNTFMLKDLSYTLTYNNFETDTALSSLPTEWNAGKYTFACTTSMANETINASLVIVVNQISNETIYEFSVNESKTEATAEYDNSPVLGNDPSLEIFIGEEPSNAEFKVYYISSQNYTAYKNLTTATEKQNFLKQNKVEYSGTYQMVPADYYFFAVINNGQNYLDFYTNVVKLTITNAEQDYSMLNLSMDYTFSTDTCTGEYVTFAQIVEEVGMPTIEEFDGTYDWAEDYSNLQIAYSASNPTLKFKLKITPNNPYINYSPTEFDVTLNLNQGLIAIPTLKDDQTTFPNFMYTGDEQGITLENGSLYFNNWFSANDAKFFTANFDTHTDVGDYKLTITLSNNPNFAFSADGKTASEQTTLEYNWGINKAHHHCYVEGLPESPIHVVDSDRIETTMVLPADGKITLATFAKFHYSPYLDTTLSYEILTENEAGVTYGTATIEGTNLVVTTAGTIVVKITNPGNDNLNAIELVVVYHITEA